MRPNYFKHSVDVVDFEYDTNAASGGTLEHLLRHKREPMIVADIELDEPRLFFVWMRPIDPKA